MGLSWQDIHAGALHRIQSREWQPGALIPNEEELAKDLGWNVAKPAPGSPYRQYAALRWPFR